VGGTATQVRDETDAARVVQHAHPFMPDACG
jgi:hypothetical protein